MKISYWTVETGLEDYMRDSYKLNPNILLNILKFNPMWEHEIKEFGVRLMTDSGGWQMQKGQITSFDILLENYQKVIKFSDFLFSIDVPDYCGDFNKSIEKTIEMLKRQWEYCDGYQDKLISILHGATFPQFNKWLEDTATPFGTGRVSLANKQVTKFSVSTPETRFIYFLYLLCKYPDLNWRQVHLMGTFSPRLLIYIKPIYDLMADRVEDLTFDSKIIKITSVNLTRFLFKNGRITYERINKGDTQSIDNVFYGKLIYENLKTFLDFSDYLFNKVSLEEWKKEYLSSIKNEVVSKCLYYLIKGDKNKIISLLEGGSLRLEL